MYKQVIVVEGTHDMIKVHEVYPEAVVVVTNGTEVSSETLQMIKEYSKDNEIVCLLDPDFPGEKIRQKIVEVVPNAKHVFIKKSLCISNNKKKVGVEHAKASDVKEALDSCLTIKEKKNPDIVMSDLYNLNLVGNQSLRAFVSDRLTIGRPNVKTFLKRINMFDISIEELKKIVGEYNE